ncbi:MAG: hypothetical protein QGI90_01725 [Nitrospinaceae bacterium]|jgi:hypothetical protein|nr:hypothetical protein [Nitrospinaceae bacterium]MDP7147394.1 hypothetical protein [Nitrospinaceae bacterium]|tara:strand:+ start:5702 stop:5872 length:171 start_codon:yes stop_codon:yes gene_type:complete
MNEDPNHDIGLKEIVTTHILSMEVIIEIMIEKGLVTREEYINRVQQMKARRNPGSH